MRGTLWTVALCLFIVASNQYALEGRWTLTNHEDIKLDPMLDIEFEFEAILKKDNTIKR